MPTALVFTGSLLPASETFIDQHARSLRRFDSVLVGLKKVAGIATDPAKTCLLSLNPVQKLALYFWGTCPPLDKIVKDRGVVLLHAHFLDNGLLLARYAARKRLPLIVTLHGADVLRHPAAISWRRRVFRHLLHKTLLKVATRFLPVSDFLTVECERLGYPAAKLTRHYLGIRLAQGDVAQAEPANRTVLFVGRLVEKKGIAYLSGAIETLVRQGSSIRGVFVGTGPLDGYLRNIARDRNLPIELRGALPHAAVLEEMKAAAIFCMPSTQAADGDNEGLGLVFLEAQMLGVPVVAFRQGPVPEAVIDGETGLLATDRNTQDLARALTTLLDDPDLRQRMGRNGQRFVRTTFDLAQQADRLEDIYDAVLRERTAPAGLGQTALKNH